MNVAYLQERRATREAARVQTERQLAELQARDVALQGAIAEIDAQLNQGKLAADCVARMFEEPPMLKEPPVAGRASA